MDLSTPRPLEIGGYVLAGGRSSRMGRDKALIDLAGRPLIAHAVSKLRRVCAEVSVLSSDPALATYAPLIPDIHPDCGPIAGIEAALTHTTRDWNLFLPVDTPFLPAALIHNLAAIADSGDPTPQIRIFTVDGRPQPGFCLLNRSIAPLLTRAILRGSYALVQVFEEIGRELPSGLCNSPLIDPSTRILSIMTGLSTRTEGDLESPGWCILTPAQRAAQHLWFLNLNTPEDLVLAEANLAALDT